MNAIILHELEEEMDFTAYVLYGRTIMCNWFCNEEEFKIKKNKLRIKAFVACLRIAVVWVSRFALKHFTGLLIRLKCVFSGKNKTPFYRNVCANLPSCFLHLDNYPFSLPMYQYSHYKKRVRGFYLNVFLFVLFNSLTRPLSCLCFFLFYTLTLTVRARGEIFFS